MPKVFPFHAAADPVYHDNDQCKKGQEVPLERRLKGNEGKPLCKECAELDQLGK
jgi:formylmethanofuran dehydrogenase subunit E